jgi:hypothetical protein
LKNFVLSESVWVAHWVLFLHYDRLWSCAVGERGHRKVALEFTWWEQMPIFIHDLLSVKVFKNKEQNLPWFQRKDRILYSGLQNLPVNLTANTVTTIQLIWIRHSQRDLEFQMRNTSRLAMVTPIDVRFVD